MIVRVAASIAAGLLTYGTLNNVSETFLTMRAHRKWKDTTSNVQYNQGDTLDILMNSSVRNSEDILKDLQKLKRTEFLELFMNCDHYQPTSDEEMQSLMKGEWNGTLLNNNLIMTSVSAFITHKIFGRGRLWKGKAFSMNLDEPSLGCNIFVNRETGTTDNEHLFQYTLCPSRFMNDGSKSILLKYSEYQGLFSLWKTMEDEVRILKPPTKGCDVILIGLGSMGWSGGFWNGAPFCLVRNSNDKGDK